MSTPRETFRLRSFVRRDGRRTAGQERAHNELWPVFGLSVEEGLVDGDKVFGRSAPRYLEIGFGSGQSLLAAAAAFPDKDFMGVETHKPGVGSLFLGIQAANLTNLRVFYQDVIDVLAQSIANESLDGIQIYFPDPWQKRKHHPRRLIQPAFIKTVVEKLKQGGSLHLATDWEDYSQHMMKVVSAETSLQNLAGRGLFAERSIYRPVISKFERRAMKEGRHIWELQLQKTVSP